MTASFSFPKLLWIIQIKYSANVAPKNVLSYPNRHSRQTIGSLSPDCQYGYIERLTNTEGKL